MVNSSIAITASVVGLVLGGFVYYIFSTSNSSAQSAFPTNPVENYGRDSYVSTNPYAFRPSEGGRRRNTSKNNKKIIKKSKKYRK